MSKTKAAAMVGSNMKKSTGTDQSLVAIHGRTACPTSLKIAEVLGWRHKNVLQAIENLEAPDRFNRLDFQPVH